MAGRAGQSQAVVSSEGWCSRSDKQGASEDLARPALWPQPQCREGRLTVRSGGRWGGQLKAPPALTGGGHREGRRGLRARARTHQTALQRRVEEVRVGGASDTLSLMGQW